MVEKIRSIAAADPYTRYHAPRYAELLALLSEYVNVSTKVLDFGRSLLSDWISWGFSIPVDSLDIYSEGPTPTGRQYKFDLNDAADPARWRKDIPQYDVIVMAEVIEHIHTSPTQILSFVKSLMAPGGVLVIQTPNAAVLHKRVKLLMGRNPYELIREDANDPGHFREYTDRELIAYADQAGLRVERCFLRSYFDLSVRVRRPGAPTSKAWALATNLYRYAPRHWRPGITLVLRRPAA